MTLGRSPGALCRAEVTVEELRDDSEARPLLPPDHGPSWLVDEVGPMLSPAGEGTDTPASGRPHFAFNRRFALPGSW